MMYEYAQLAYRIIYRNTKQPQMPIRTTVLVSARYEEIHLIDRKVEN